MMKYISRPSEVEVSLGKAVDTGDPLVLVTFFGNVSPSQMELAPDVAERLLLELHSAVMTLRGIEKPVQRSKRERMSLAVRMLAGRQ